MWPTIIVIVIAVAFFMWLFIFLRTLCTLEKRTTKAAMRQGRKNALVFLVVLLTAILVTAHAIRFIFDRTLNESIIQAFGVLLVLSFISFFLRWFWSKSKKGRLVLDCGEHPAKGLYLFQARMLSFVTSLFFVSLLVGVPY